MPEHILRTLQWVLGGLALVLATRVLTSPALAADFYQGKTLTVIVGYAPGGGVDAGARTITRHLGRFIPGHPNIVVQNMEGAAGMVSLNHLDRRVAPDGLTLAVPGRSWYIDSIVRRPGIGIDPTRLTYLGSPGAVSAAGFVHARTGITTYAGLKAASKPVTFGALGATTPTAMAPALLAANGAPVKVVLGYVSTARVLLALEQGEIDGTFTVGSALAARSDLAAKMATLVQTAPTRRGVPFLRDVVQASQRPVVDLVQAPDSIGLPLIGPVGMPAEVTAVLRQAFLAMAADQDYQVDAERVDLPVGQPIEGSRIAQMIAALAANATPEVVAEFNRLAGAR
jgi:tripartite-type tricarboxylate transporter receptor subunit TctC